MSKLGFGCVSAHLHSVHVGLHLQLLHQLPGLCNAGRVIARHERRHFRASLRVLSAGREKTADVNWLAHFCRRMFNGDSVAFRSLV